MKLNTKFSFLSISLVVLIFSLFCILYYNVNRTSDFKNYEYRLTKIQYGVSELSSFIDSVDYSGVNLDTFYDDWTSKYNTVVGDASLIVNDRTKQQFSEDIIKDINHFDTYWLILQNCYREINLSYKQINLQTYPESFKSYASTYGLKEAVNRFENESNTMNSVKKIFDNIEIEMIKLRQAKNNIDKVNIKLSTSLNVFISDYSRRAFFMAGILVLIVTVIVLVIVYTITSKISERIKTSKEMVEKLAEKDFTTNVIPEGSSEIKGLMSGLNSTVTQLNHLFLKIKEVSAKVLSSGFAINNSATSTAVAINEINASIESITKEFDQLFSSVEHVGDSISHMDTIVNILVNDNSNQFKSIEESSMATNNMAQTLEDVTKKALERTQAAEEMKILVEDGGAKILTTGEILNQVTNKLDEISEIVNIINAIAEQTNLLSMNAAIESAHAGEAGKGFSVVAEEIRSLAESTSENAQQIKKSIEDIVSSVENANNSSAEAEKAFAKVSDSTHELINSLQSISKGIADIDSQGKAIASGSQLLTNTAEKIGEHCEKLEDQQKQISTEMNTIKNVFTEATAGIKEIRIGTNDIVARMREVNDRSEESYHNMADLENIIDEFKTADGTKTEEKPEEAVAQEPDIANVDAILQEAQQAEKELLKKDTEKIESSDIEFDLDNIEEVTF